MFNYKQLFKISFILLLISGCRSTMYDVPEPYWHNLTDIQKQQVVNDYYAREQQRYLNQSLWEVGRERWRTEEALQRANEAEWRAREAEQRAQEVEHQVLDQQKRAPERFQDNYSRGGEVYQEKSREHFREEHTPNRERQGQEGLKEGRNK